MDTNEMQSMFRCPATGRKLVRQGDTLVTENGDAAEYRIVKDFPILVDFEKSILDADETCHFESVVARPPARGIKKWLRQLVSPAKGITAANMNHFIALLKQEHARPRVLVIGGGTIGQGMEALYQDADIEVVAFDIYVSPFVQFVADAHDIPLADGEFDAVIIQAVLEHVLEPDRVVAEIYRVLKQDGLVYAETPFLQHVHEAAWDFTRFTESGHRWLFRNFELIRSGASAGAGTQLLWSIDNFFRGLFRSRVAGKVMKLCFFWVRFFDHLIPEAYNVDAASGVFFMGRKQTGSVQPVEMVVHYKGAQ